MADCGGILRFVTNRQLRGDRFTLEAAAAIGDGWIVQPKGRLLAQGDHHWSILKPAMVRLDGQVRGPLITDAQLVALTIEYEGVLYTTDRGFARPPGLRWTNPLQAAARQ